MGRKKANFGATKPRSETSLFLTDALQWRGNWAKMGRNGAKISFFNMIKKYHFFFFGWESSKFDVFPVQYSEILGKNWGELGQIWVKKALFQCIYQKRSFSRNIL